MKRVSRFCITNESLALVFVSYARVILITFETVIFAASLQAMHLFASDE